MYGDTLLNWGAIAWYLSPELIVLATALLLLGLDLVEHQRVQHWLPYVSLAGLTLALVATVTLGQQTERVLAVFQLDLFAVCIKAITWVTMALLVLVSEDYLRAHTDQSALFYALLLLAALSISLLGAATELITIFLLFDLLSILSYLLTGYLRHDQYGTEAAFKYFIYGATLSAVMLYGFSWLYGLTGSTDLLWIAASLRMIEQFISPLALVPILILILAGLAYKVAAAPFHHWAPDAYEGAPTPVTAFLSVAPKIAGFALLLRVVLVLFPGVLTLGSDLRWPLLTFLSAFAMVVGNLAALGQDNIKRLMAYSSIAQAGYILIGVAVATSRGVTAVLFYLVAYAVTNLGAFAAIIAFANQTGSELIASYAGGHKRAALLAAVLTICLLSLAGIPGTAGFMGKLWLFSAAIESGLVWLAVLGVINSVISVGYYWKVIQALYLAPMIREDKLETPPLLKIVLGLTLGAVLLVGLFPSLVLPWLESAAQLFFAG